MSPREQYPVPFLKNLQRIWPGSKGLDGSSGGVSSGVSNGVSDTSVSEGVWIAVEAVASESTEAGPNGSDGGVSEGVLLAVEPVVIKASIKSSESSSTEVSGGAWLAVSAVSAIVSESIKAGMTSGDSSLSDGVPRGVLKFAEAVDSEHSDAMTAEPVSGVGMVVCAAMDPVTGSWVVASSGSCGDKSVIVATVIEACVEFGINPTARDEGRHTLLSWYSGVVCNDRRLCG
jgi:hypothetical protein